VRRVTLGPGGQGPLQQRFSQTPEPTPAPAAPKPAPVPLGEEAHAIPGHVVPVDPPEWETQQERLNSWGDGFEDLAEEPAASEALAPAVEPTAPPQIPAPKVRPEPPAEPPQAAEPLLPPAILPVAPAPAPAPKLPQKGGPPTPDYLPWSTTSKPVHTDDGEPPASEPFDMPVEPPEERPLYQKVPPPPLPRSTALPKQQPIKAQAVDREEDYFGFMLRVGAQPPQAWLVEGLIPDEGNVLWHGKPRALKTLTTMAVMLALAGSKPALGAYSVGHARRVGHLNEEDPERLFYSRLELFAAGGLEPIPGHYFPQVRKGHNLDIPDGRSRLRSFIEKNQIEVLVLEPMRSLSALIEKTAAEFSPVRRFISELGRDTSCKTFVFGHHDVKSPPGGKDQRSRSEQASGSALFSFSDCPGWFEKQDWQTTLVRLEDYKLSADPEPFTVRFRTSSEGEDSHRFINLIRPEIVSLSLKEADTFKERERLLKALTANPWASGTAIAEEAKVRKQEGLALLHRMEKEGMVESITGEEAKAAGAKTSQAVLWAIKGTPKPSKKTEQGGG
jgi:hypothetical protein